MKYTVVAASLLALAAAQPHHGHKHAHKRDNVVVETDYVTATAPDVVVYVDQYGNSINGPAQATNAPAYAPAPAPVAQPTYAPAAAPAPAPVSAPAPAPVAASPKQSSAPAAAPAPAPAPASSSPSTSAGSSSGSNSTKKGGLGITYSPYRADGQCKTADEVMSDFDMLTEYSSVRIYNTDCNQIATVGKAAQKHNMEVLAGIFHIDDMSSAIAALASGFSSNWAGISSVAIGNELVNSGQKSVDQVVNAVNTGRTLLRAAGFQGDVVTVDTNNILREPAGKPLCDASDFVAVNAHPFFGSVLPEDSGDWLKTEIQKIQTNCPGKRVVVTESGWPSQGSANGPSIPSEANQKTSIASLKAAMSSDMYLFTAFNDPWKAPGAFDCEQYWGVYGNSAY